MTIGFKVCKIFDDKFYSASIASTSDIGATEYIMNTAVFPTDLNGPLTVFLTREQAEDWLDDWVGKGTSAAIVAARAHFALFKCDYIPDSSNYVFINTGKTYTSSTMHISKGPSGTALANSVTLTQRINWE
jgi:hypothetical protein